MAKRTGDKYEAIINAAVRVIAKHGYHHARIATIASEANIADGTIYLYFENKDDLLVSLFKEKMGQFIRALEQRLDSMDDPLEQLKTLIAAHFQHLEDDPELAIVTQIELRQSNPRVRQGIGHILKSYLNLIDAIVLSGQKTGVFRDEVDAKMVRKMIFGTLDELVTSWIMNGRKYSLIEMTDSVHDLLVNGLRHT